MPTFPVVLITTNWVVLAPRFSLGLIPKKLALVDNPANIEDTSF